MVKKEVKKYLVEGLSRGYHMEELKKNLLSTGFHHHDIDEAAWELENASKKHLEEKPVPTHTKEDNKEETKAGEIQTNNKKTPPEKIKANVTDIDKKVAEEKGTLGFFPKVWLASIKPFELFKSIKTEKIYPALAQYYLLMILPFLILIGIGGTLSFEIISETNKFIQTLSPALAEVTLTELGGWAILLITIALVIAQFILLPILLFLKTGIIYTTSLIYQTKGTYTSTFKTLIYTSTPLILLFWLPIIPVAGVYLLGLLTIWLLVVFTKGIQITHETTITKAILITATTIIIEGLLLYAITLTL